MTYPVFANTSYAGYYGPNAVLDGVGSLLTNAAITLYVANADGSPSSTGANFYSNENRTPLGGTPSTDNYGNLFFWTDPGVYVLTVTGASQSLLVTINPLYPDASWNNVPTAVSDSSVMQGEVVVVNAVAATTQTLPSPYNGQRFKVINQSTGAVTVTTGASGSHPYIIGPGLGSTSNSMVLGTLGSFVELWSNGTDFFVTAGAQDSGWQAFNSATTGWSYPNSGNLPQYRLMGNTVYFKGEVANFSTLDHLALPTTFNIIPKVTSQFALAQTDLSGVTGAMQVSNIAGAANLTWLTTSPSGGSYPIWLNGMIYTVD